MTTAADRRAWRVWALALLVLCVAWLGAAPLFDVDEGAFSEATREMLASHDFVEGPRAFTEKRQPEWTGR